MLINFEPHGFVVFLTISMGLVYAATRTRGGWGFWKLAVVGIFVLPFLYYGVVIGRVVEVVAGSLIGLVYARGGGGFAFSILNPFTGIVEYFQDRRANRAAKKAFKKANREESKQQRAQSRGEKKTSQSNSKNSSSSTQSGEEEARRRKAEAKYRRYGAGYAYEEAQKEKAQKEKAEKKKADSNSGANQSSSGRSGYRSNQSYKSRPPKEPEKRVDNRTSYQILGVSTDATPAQIKKAYGMLRSRYHPDKYEHMSDTFKCEAADEFKKVQKAWDAIRSR